MASTEGWGVGPQAELVETMAKAVGGEGTTAMGNFFRAHVESFGFMNFVSSLPRHVDNVMDSLHDKTEEPPKSRVFQQGLDPFRRLLAELLMTKAVDSYLTYVSELLTLVFRERPETLRSKEKISVEFVLGFDSLEELQAAIAERRVDRLAYSGMAELAEWIRDTLGFTLVDDHDDQRKLMRLVEKRNLIVHHRGIIDHRYIAKCGVSDGTVGDELNLAKDVADAFIVLSEAVWSADRRAAEKWSLARFALPTDCGRPWFKN